ncbi:hypothetical protein SAICODRAFT_72804 [Saitoella complicata NRRL Y-17804]|nr:uncharacterized protein SAICODRAFT_72804 [Saitoella complicata NRRL Y-17804]ODQ51197.1 hypothetical protein SAICODRAFT_72804 [Saitoella complicata NRRL Y-17804]
MAGALRPWLKEELLKALNDAKELPIDMGRLGILQIQKFTDYEADPSAGKMISAQLSDKDTYIHCYFTFKCQKEFEQIRESRLTQHKGALVKLLSYKLNVAHHKQTRVISLEVDELAYKSSQGEAIFGDPKAAHNYPEIKRVLRMDHIERLMGPDPLESVKEKEVTPPLPPPKEKTPESSPLLTSQIYQTQMPMESQFTTQAPPEDESKDEEVGELAEDHEPQPDSESEEEEEEEEEEEYLHPAWGGLRWENLKWEDIRIPPDQQALLDREDAWYWPGCDDPVEEVLEDEEQVYLEHNANLAMPDIVNDDPLAGQRLQGAKEQVMPSSAQPAMSNQNAPALDEVVTAESDNTAQFMTQAPMDLSQKSEHNPTSSDDLRTQQHSALSEADEPVPSHEKPYGEEDWPATSPVPEAQPEEEADEDNLPAKDVVVKVETTVVQAIKEEVLSQQYANDDTEMVDHPGPEPLLEELDLTIEELHEMEEEERLLSQPAPSRSSQPESPEIGDESEEFIEQSAENGLGDVERIFQSSVEEVVSSSGAQQPIAPPPTLVTEPAKEDVGVRLEVREEVQVERTIEIPDTVLQESVSQPPEAATAPLQEREEEAPPAPTQGSETQDITREIFAEDVAEAVLDVIERAGDVHMADVLVVEKPIEGFTAPNRSEVVVREQNGEKTSEKPLETVDNSIGEAAAAAATVPSTPANASPAPAVQSLAKEPSVRRQSSLSSLFKEAIMGNTPRTSKATSKPSHLVRLRSSKIQLANQTAKRKRSSEVATASPAASKSNEMAAKRPKTKEKYPRVIPDFSGLEAPEEDIATIIKKDRARFLAERRAKEGLSAIDPDLEEEDEEIVDTEMGRFAKLWLKVNGKIKSTKGKADPLDWRRKLA